MDLTDFSFTMDDSKEDLQMSIADEAKDFCEIVETVQESVSRLAEFDIEEIDHNLLRPIMPKIADTLKKLCQLNESNLNGDLNATRETLTQIVVLLKAELEILDYIQKHNNVTFKQVIHVPLNISTSVLSVLQHYNSNKTKYMDETFNTLGEIQVMLKNSQDLLVKLLKCLPSLSISVSNNKDEVTTLCSLLEELSSLSKILVDLNLAGFIENWKGFTVLLQKHCILLSGSNLDLSGILSNLSEQTSKFLGQVLESSGPQHLPKIMGIINFLVKVFVKFEEACPRLCQTYSEDVLYFCLSLFVVPSGYFQSRNFSQDVVNKYSDSLSLMESFISKKLEDRIFLESIFRLKFRDLLDKKYEFLLFSNKILELLAQEDNPRNKVADLIDLIFKVSGHCYKEYLCDDGSLYDNLVTNMCVVILLCPKDYPDVECILTENIVQNDKIWTALLAIDTWTLVLRNCPSDTVISTLTSLIRQGRELSLGNFTDLPSVIFSRVLIQRIAKLLPSNSLGNILKSNSPSRFLSLGIISAPQRLHVEPIIGDLIERIEAFERGNSSTFKNVTNLIETFDAVSSINFTPLGLKGTVLLLPLIRLWDKLTPLSLGTNIYYQYFMYKLAKITITVIAIEVDVDDVLMVLKKFATLMDCSDLFQYLMCDFLKSLSAHQFSANYKQKPVLHKLVGDIFKVLLSNTANPLVVQLALESLEIMSKSDNFEPVITSIMATHLKNKVVDYAEKTAGSWDLEPQHFDVLSTFNFEHRCLHSNRSIVEPPSKKIKLFSTTQVEQPRVVKEIVESNVSPKVGADEESDIDEAMHNLKSATASLVKKGRKVPMDKNQIKDLKIIMGKLKTLLVQEQ